MSAAREVSVTITPNTSAWSVALSRATMFGPMVGAFAVTQAMRDFDAAMLRLGKELAKHGPLIHGFGEIRYECDECGVAACDLPDGIDPDLIFEGCCGQVFCQGCLTQHICGAGSD